MRLNITVKHSRDGGVIPNLLFGLPVALKLSSPDLSTPPSSENFIITGKNWEDATINQVGVGEMRRIKGTVSPSPSPSKGD